eukprot:TRINITY_DN9936_c0_g2_i1.p2 TRINITY_DN9936_c0_g2~~TRINITY_DN9936_c0_g2_i1.p2  ORF type:complete len:156 (-),score=8.43 TRINITY_DN9936_c0_g2_i1:941-1408(-)
MPPQRLESSSENIFMMRPRELSPCMLATTCFSICDRVGVPWSVSRTKKHSAVAPTFKASRVRQFLGLELCPHKVANASPSRAWRLTTKTKRRACTASEPPNHEDEENKDDEDKQTLGPSASADPPSCIRVKCVQAIPHEPKRLVIGLPARNKSTM